MSKQRNRANGQAGFSLLELMTVIIIVMIMTALALPLLLSAIEGYQMEGAARNVGSLIARARYEAQRRNTRVCVAFIPSPTVPGQVDYLMNTAGPAPDPCSAPPVYDAGEVFYGMPRNLVLGGVKGSATCPANGMPNPWGFAIAGSPPGGLNPPNFQVNFSPRGFIELPGIAPGTYTIARDVEYFCLVSPPTAANANTARFAFLVYLEPTGKVRLFRRQGPQWFTMQ